MLFEDINRKTWQAYENSRRLYSEHSVLYCLKLGFLILVPLLLAALFIGITLLVFLWLLGKPFSATGKLWIILGISTIAFAYIYFKTLMARPWRGMLLLKKCDYPGFYSEVNEVALVMNAPKIHRIYISPEFNARIASAFTFIPGLRRNVLILGYPLLCSVSSKALLGCLAHEAAHLSRNHLFSYGVFNNAIALLNACRQGPFFGILTLFWSDFVLRGLERTLCPIYSRHEIEADKTAVDKLGSQYAAECLLQIELKRNMFERCGELVDRLASEDLQSVGIARMIREILQKPLDRADSETALAKAMKRIPPVFDPHQAFRERLAIANVKDPLAHALAEPDAFKKFIGSREHFFAAVEDFYSKGRFYIDLAAECKNQQQRMADFDIDKDYSLDETMKYIAGLAFFARKDALSEMISRSLKRFPDALELKCLFLLEQLEKTDDSDETTSIISELEELARKSPMLIYMLNDALLMHYLEHGENEKIKSFFDLRDASVVKNKKYFKTRISEKDNLAALSLNDSEKKKIVDICAKYKSVFAVYLVERRHENLHYGEPLLFLGFKDAFWRLSSMDEIVRVVRPSFPAFRVEKSVNKLSNALDSIPGACIWRREK